VKIRSVARNNHKRAFEVRTWSKTFVFPYARADPQPSRTDRIAELFVDEEMAREGFTFALESGKEGSVHIDHVLEYNRDPSYMRDLLLYKLTVEAQKRIASSSLSKRELIRRLGTSATQFYRLLDQTNYRKSVDQMLSLLQLLDCEVQLVVRSKGA